MMPDKDEILVPAARKGLDKLKIDAANQTLGKETNQKITAENYESVLDAKKWEAAEELGLKEKVESVGWANMTTAEVGKIGGATGGKIGGTMVKELIAKAEEQMAPVAKEAIDKKAIEAGPTG